EGLADRIMVMSEGKIIESGPLHEVFRNPLQPVTQEILNAWKSPSNRPRAASNGVCEPIVTAQGLTKTYFRRIGMSRRLVPVIALDDVDFTIKGNSVTALSGPSGAGKSSLARCLAGLEQPDRGTVHTRLRSRHQIQYVYQDALGAMNPRMTVSEI